MIAEPPVIKVSQSLLSKRPTANKPTCSKHRVKQHYPAIGNVLWKLVVEQLWLRSVFVALYQNLANANRPAAVSKTLFHGFSSSHDRYATDFALEHQPIVNAADWRGDVVVYHWEVIQALLHQKPNDAV